MKDYEFINKPIYLSFILFVLHLIIYIILKYLLNSDFNGFLSIFVGLFVILFVASFYYDKTKNKISKNTRFESVVIYTFLIFVATPLLIEFGFSLEIFDYLSYLTGQIELFYILFRILFVAFIQYWLLSIPWK